MPIRKSFADMENATRGLFASRKNEVLHVRASISYAGLILAPNLVDFHRKHPGISIHLSTYVWSDRFLDDQTDMDIRYGHGEWSDGNVLSLGHEYATLVCHPEFAKASGENLTIQELVHKQVLYITGSEDDWRRLSERHEFNLKLPSQGLKVDSSFVALQAAIAGKGSVIVIESFAHEYLKQGILVAPFNYHLPVLPSHFLVQRKGTENRESVKLFSTWIMALTQEK